MSAQKVSEDVTVLSHIVQIDAMTVALALRKVNVSVTKGGQAGSVKWLLIAQVMVRSLKAYVNVILGGAMLSVHNASIVLMPALPMVSALSFLPLALSPHCLVALCPPLSSPVNLIPLPPSPLVLLS